MLYFVGAGPGAKDLITVRGMKLLQIADVVIYAGSLVNPELLEYCKSDCSVYDSSQLTFNEIINIISDSEREGKMLVRLHTGDPSLFGAVKEQMDELDKLGVKPIEALGVEFNPEFHNAVMQEDSEEFEEGFVCKELQKGYTYRDSVVRHSMVAVAK